MTSRTETKHEQREIGMLPDGGTSWQRARGLGIGLGGQKPWGMRLDSLLRARVSLIPSASSLLPRCNSLFVTTGNGDLTRCYGGLIPVFTRSVRPGSDRNSCIFPDKQGI